MAIARVQAANSGTGTVATGSIAATFGSSVAVGDGLICCVSNHDATAATTVTGISDGTANVYTQVAGARKAGTQEMADLWICKNVGVGGTLTVTATFAASVGGAALTVIEVSGQDTVTFIDQVASAAGTSTAPNSGATAATTAANEFVVGFTAPNNDNLSTAPTFSTALTSRVTETLCGNSVLKTSNSVFDGLLASSGVAMTFNSTIGSSLQWVCICATFLPAAAVAAVRPLQIRLAAVPNVLQTRIHSFFQQQHLAPLIPAPRPLQIHLVSKSLFTPLPITKSQRISQHLAPLRPQPRPIQRTLASLPLKVRTGEGRVIHVVPKTATLRPTPRPLQTHLATLPWKVRIGEGRVLHITPKIPPASVVIVIPAVRPLEVRLTALQWDLFLTGRRIVISPHLPIPPPPLPPPPPAILHPPGKMERVGASPLHGQPGSQLSRGGVQPLHGQQGNQLERTTTHPLHKQTQ